MAGPICKRFSRHRVRQQQNKLVATEAGEGIARVQKAADPPCHDAEQLVACRVTQAVVDNLEPVEIQKQQRERVLVASRMLDRFLDPEH